jgi:hypothetical protein
MAASPVADDCFSSAHVEKRCAPAGVEYRLVGSQEECDWHNDVLLSLCGETSSLALLSPSQRIANPIASDGRSAAAVLERRPYVSA